MPLNHSIFKLAYEVNSVMPILPPLGRLIPDSLASLSWSFLTSDSVFFPYTSDPSFLGCVWGGLPSAVHGQLLFGSRSDVSKGSVLPFPRLGMGCS